ncbi:YpmS family protein [Aerococcus viridans]|uniref:YpmS family protein n=1 Tax=Aerococcus viridans TaxID=1377 RepID=UPI0028FD5283|nr:YpmS family protein [Aerococcus viridans]
MAKQTNTNTKKPFNPWKWAFWLLLLAILVPVIGFYLYIQTASQETASLSEPVTTEEASDETITAEANLSTISFNRLVSAVIGGEDVPYHLTVDDEVSFAGLIDALGTEVAYTMQGHPSVMEDGNIAIDVTNIELAGLQLPTSTVLAIFQLTLPTDLPLQVLSGEEQIIIRLDQVSEDMDFAIRASDIDLANDEINILLDVPLTYIEEQIGTEAEGNQ